MKSPRRCPEAAAFAAWAGWLGWTRTHNHGERIVWHNGGTGGFRSFLGCSEVTGRGVVLMANGQLELDALGMHLLNPAFPLGPASSDGGSSAFKWVGAVIALFMLIGMAWALRRPRSRVEQWLELAVAAAFMALAWRVAGDSSFWLAWAACGLALPLGVAALWRGRRQPVLPAGTRPLLVALLTAGVGLLRVAWLW